MGLEFKGEWRSYQKRILDSLSFHLADDKLHIIAAPGAGKTTLGIEVISRLNSPTLILCPTNTIKNQWKERICNAFLTENEYDTVSTDIRDPKNITVITYQALLAAFCGKKNIDDVNDSENIEITEDEEENETIISSKRFNSQKAEEIIKNLKKAKISVLCFDEAHHLRKEWWKALTYLVDNLNPRQTLSLTATPPYDVSYSEWQRYENLCGEIDEVISIPELVQNGDLCPHQDFVHFSLLRDNETEFIKKHNLNIAKFIDKLLNDRQLILYLRGLSTLNPTNDNDVETIFENPELYVSIASLLKATGVQINKSFASLFDAQPEDIPKFNLKEAKIFLNGFLVTNSSDFPNMEDKIAEYLSFAKSLGLIHNKRIVLDESVKIQKQIAGSMGKLDSILQIVELEHDCLKSALRMVILSDFIKENDVDNSHLGVIPIWRTLKNKFTRIHIGVLCGSLILLPYDCERYFYQILEKNGISRDNVTISDYKQDNKFIRITPNESAKHNIVNVVTELFNQGYVNILIGTQALLGEGWDAPCINSLILSSTVSSYMLSNQMRGRAIRIDKNNPNKISNIWHLASVKLPRKNEFQNNKIFTPVTTSDYVDNTSAVMYDIHQLQKRFEGFEAPSYYYNHEIVNGFSRVFKESNYELMSLYGENLFTDLNIKTMELAKNRVQTKKWWEESLYHGYNSGYTKQLVKGIESDPLCTKHLCFTGYKQILYSIIMQLIGVLICIMGECPAKIAYIIWFIIFLISVLYIGINYLRTGTVEGVMKQVAIVHLETLAGCDFIKTSLKHAGICVSKSDTGIFVHSNNLPEDENNIFISSLKEFLDPIENPRYILIRRKKIWNIINQTDYYAIPSIIGTRQKHVDMFKSLWKKYIGPCEILYTRNIEGRKLLLKARKRAFSAMKRENSKKVSRWS